MILPVLVNAQKATSPEKTVNIENNGDITITWKFPDYDLHTINIQDTEFSKLSIPEFGYMHETGKPDIPAYIDHIATPQNSDVNINIKNISYYSEKQDILLLPSQPPRQDNYQSEDPPFTMDTSFYQKDVAFPANHLRSDESQDMRDIKVAAVQIIPFQYNPAQQKLKSIKEISYTISYTGSPQLITDGKQHSDHFAKLVSRYFLNGQKIAAQIASAPKSASQDPDYLIITTQQYMQAAEALSEWKSQLGFHTEIISQNSWNSGQVKNAIHSRYNNYSPKPDYFVIIGDHNDVPGEILSGSNGTFASDLYYSCMGGSSDYTADMAKGRISVSNTTEANRIVNKVINYEKTPVADSSFYQTGLNCAYFQHAGSGYAERRFAQTSEDLRTYAVSQGYNVNRVYHADAGVYPTYWNNTYYSNGEPLPSYLTKPNFAWDGDKYDIINHVNNGTFYVFHRDHGYTLGWGDPAFNNSDINSLNNGDKLPIFFSINCLTGKFLESECFTEKLLRKSNGGAVGVFGHAEVSYSGYNDALSLGLFDGIWSNPGIVPNFTGSGGIYNPSIPSHADIRRGGDLVNWGLQYMTATWGNNQYTYELFHYFGDPAMEFRVNYPDPITATNIDSISCSNDTSIIVNNINTDSVTATLVVDGELLGKDLLRSPTDTLYFTSAAGNIALLTLSKPGYKPYVDSLTITGGCPKAEILTSSSMYCVGDSITFSENSFGNISSYSWTFGSGATPATANTSGPHTIGYSTGGNKTVYLTVSTSGSLSHTDSVKFYIDPICKYTVPPSGNLTIDRCNGLLFDDGGEFADYSNNTDGSVTISPVGASSISLTFSDFGFESGYDYLKVYDGASTSAPLIGSYDGASLPGGGVINSSSGEITIQQLTDPMVTESGFALEWQCSYPNTSPTADFVASDTTTCTGYVEFQDQSIAGPSSWHWNFGDGTSSTQQNPTHQYTSNGTYTVKLTVTNTHGPDSLVKTNYVTVNMPAAPTTQSDIRCKAGSVTLTATPPTSGNGYIRWFDSPTSNNVIDTGNIYTTPILTATKDYYVDYAIPKASEYGAKSDNSGGGSYYDSPYKHHLVFDVHEPITLISVKVYAGSAGNRNIELRNSNGNTIAAKNVYIQSGTQRINLDFEIPAGSNYELGGPENPDLFRNNAGTSYPYYVSNMATITESSASSNPTGYYYYFYDWEVKGAACRSNRIQVNAIISDTLSPITDFTYNDNNDPIIQFSDKSEYATSHIWNFDDGNTSNLPNPSHTYATNGTYNVELKTTNACGADSLTKQVNINTVSIENYTENTLNVYPNPTKDIITIELPEQNSGVAVIQMVDQSGKNVFADLIDSNQSEFTKNLQQYAAGSYFILLHSDDKTYISKVILE